MGRKKSIRRSVNGILLLDKPLGLTSNAALQEVKHLFRAKKAGHTGSLDPLATGMLPICFGQATKVSAFLLDANKRYQLVCKLGEKTTTGDSEGEISESRPIPNLSEKQVLSVLSRFLGEIDQVPPMYSALKHNGTRLYDLARQGLEVERKMRSVTLYELTLNHLQGPYIGLNVLCSKGTYIRTLAEDIAEALGTVGHVTELRRLAVGPYIEPSTMLTLEQLRTIATQGLEALDQQLLYIESALEEWPGVYLTSDSAFYIRQGQAVQVPHAPTTGWVRLYESNQHFIGMGQILDDGKVAPKRMFANG